MNPYFKLTLVAAAISLGACSVLDGEKVDYKSNVKAPSLMVPPDLTQLSKDTRYSVVNGGVSAATTKAQTTPDAKVPVAANGVGDIKVERQGNQRWLVVNRSADVLWAPLKDFWQESGFTLSVEERSLGIMETEWPIFHKTWFAGPLANGLMVCIPRHRATSTAPGWKPALTVVPKFSLPTVA